MNILVLYKDSGKGGIATNTRTLVEGLRRHGINVIVIGADGPGTQSILSSVDVHIVDFSSRNPLRVYSKIVRIVKKYNINLIHAQNRIPALYASVVCFFNRKIKYIWASHLVPIPSDFLHRITTKYGERAIASSIDGFRFLTDKLLIPENKVSIVNLGVDINRFVPVSIDEQKKIKCKYNIYENEKVILLYGRLVESKGHIFFLKSLSKVKDLPAVKIIFPGDGNKEYKDTLVAYAESIGVADKIIFPGFVNGRDILSITDLMVLPSEQEGYPIACVEAYCMGVPVIRTKTSGYEDTEKFCTGVDYGDTEAFGAELASFFAGDEKFKEKASLAIASKEVFSTDYMIMQYINIYKNILKNH